MTLVARQGASFADGSSVNDCVCVLSDTGCECQRVGHTTLEHN